MAKQKKIQENTEIIENSAFDQLSADQWRYVTARIENPSFSIKDCAEHLDFDVNTVYKWPKYVAQAVIDAQRDIHTAALLMRKQAIVRAMAVKVRLLDSDDEKIRSSVATEIIEWELGRATQRHEVDATVTAKGYIAFNPDDWDDSTE